MKTIGRHWRLIILGVIGWTLFGVFFALQSYVNTLYFGQQQSLGNTFAVWLICGYAWMFLTPPVIFLSEKFFISRNQIWRNLAVHFLAGSLISLLQLSIFIFIRQWLLGNPQKPFSFSTDFQKLFIGEFHINMLIYWIIVGISHLRLINQRYLERERETARLALETAQLETKLAQARLDALKMQLHPHFLFNTLNSISVLMRDDREAANRMLVRLSELLRVALKSEGAQEVSLKDELEFLRGYLEIEQVRFQDRLQVAFEVEKEALDAQVPNLILQPLVENAIRHGIAPRAEAGLIQIQAKRENGFVQLSVSDNGAGLKDSAKKSGGIGLKNTRERLEKLYGDRQQFEIVSAKNGGLQVNIKIPYHKNEQ
ncbi:MAG TPA: histidine kinase [Pyrinomonadaceae bacterium]|nr:histidine kinase [Pyrinomonadaceae bacterium]